ncbi:hypothetical protein P7K49_005214 [Saguinus oedipus]|uniref:Uncharacterized protein n=1 Tax=Saguinus oedipus TaxID=9490 RepID=A0ABQ9WD77_SAGOE|nr:hypothetical protein P7K49_005214 [Saguinus oedipus]
MPSFRKKTDDFDSEKYLMEGEEMDIVPDMDTPVRLALPWLPQVIGPRAKSSPVGSDLLPLEPTHPAGVRTSCLERPQTGALGISESATQHSLPLH